LLRKSVRREDTRAVDIADAAEKLGLTDAGRRQLANVPLSASGFAFVRSGIAGNEAEAQFRLAVLAVALAAHKLEKGGFPASLAGLAPGLLKGYLALDQPLPGYALRYHARSERRAGAPTVDSYAVTAAPEEVGQTGNRGFCVDSTGAIRFSTDGSAPKIVGGICDASVPLLR
jgi:hypothetical protein